MLWSVLSAHTAREQNDRRSLTDVLFCSSSSLQIERCSFFLDAHEEQQLELD